MKKLVLVLLAMSLITSCSNGDDNIDEKFDSEKFPQKWTLIAMSGNFPNSETTGKNMEWQEDYILMENGTFVKHRKSSGVDFEAKGKFSFENKNGAKIIELTYDSSSEIVGSCYGNETELLWIKAENKMVSTWLQCDGPGLEYKRVE